MAVRLTDPAIKKALREAATSGKRRDLADAGQEGLRVRVTPAGSASWVLACRDRSGRMRRFPVGQYPAMGVAEAREHARVVHHKVRQEGADPIAERRRERERAEAARQGVGTLAALMDVYEKQKGATLRSWPEYRRSIGRVFGKFLNRALADVTLGDLQLAADGYAAKQQAALAVRCLRPVLKWASAPGRGYVPAALAGLTAPATPSRRDRVLSRNELAALLPVLRQSSRPYAAAMEFMLLTLLRRDEVCDTCWGDVDLDAATLTIVPEKSKNRQPHVVPLSRQALELLRTLHTRRGEATQHQPEALVFATSTGAGLINWDRETKRIMLQAGLATKNPKTGAVTMIDKSPRWHRHDLRRTGATMLGEMGELPDIIEAALNHTSIHSPLAATYNRSRYRPQVAAALQRLADALPGWHRRRCWRNRAATRCRGGCAVSNAAFSPASLSGRLLADVVDECWLAAAVDRALDDATLSRWRAIHARAGAVGSHGISIPRPPSDAALQAMLGAAWWEEFDALNLTVRPVPPSADPLHYYAGSLVDGRVRERVIDAIQKLRPSVFAVAAQPLVSAIAEGKVLVQAFDGVHPVTLPAALLRGRNWTLARRGDLKINAPDETYTTFAQPTLGLPTAVSAGAPPMTGNFTGLARSDRGGRPASYDWVAFSHELFRLALQKGFRDRARAVAKMMDWCAERWEEQPEQRTIERKVRELLPPEMPARKP